MTLRVVYETHALSEDNERVIATGWLDGRLSAAGREGAAAFGERRRGTVDAIYASDLGRAVETARTAFGDGSVLDARLRECDYGTLNGRPVHELDAVRLAHVEEPFPGGESYRDAVGRTESLLGDLRLRHAGGSVLLVGHAATRYALDHLLRGVPLAAAVGAPFDWRPGWEYAA